MLRHAQVVHNKNNTTLNNNKGNNTNNSASHNNNQKRIDNLGASTDNINIFWEQMVEETVKHLQHEEENNTIDEYFDEANFDTFVDSLRQKIFDLQELCNAGARDSVMLAIQATKQEIASKFSNVLSEEDKDQLSWEHWKFVVKKRILTAKKRLYDDSDIEE